MGNKRNPIGIFDSGVGGLTVLKEVMEMLPNEDIIYLGDTARVPYGNKSRNVIVRFSTENILYLLRKKVKLVIVACNTASSLALKHLRRVFNIPIIGVIEAGVQEAVSKTKKKKIGVIGTKSTIYSNSYKRSITKIDSSIKVYQQACPLFVPLIEEGILKGEIIDIFIQLYLSRLKHIGIDVLILGCTHYPLIQKPIAKFLKNVKIINSAKAVALYTKNMMEKYNLINTKNNRGGKYRFYVTDEPKEFTDIAKIFLNNFLKNINIRNINIY